MKNSPVSLTLPPGATWVRPVSVTRRVTRDATCRTQVLLIMAVGLLVVMTALPSLASAANDRLLYGMTGCCAIGTLNSKEPLISADTVTAENQESTAFSSYGEYVLSPNGQLIAYMSAPGTVSLARTDGSHSEIVTTDATLQAFDAAGTKLLIVGGPENPVCQGPCWLSLTGTEATPIPIEWTGTLRGPSISPGGTQIAWAALGTTSKTKKTYNIFTANADGSSQKQITFFSEKTTPELVYLEPRFGPGLIAFWGSPTSTAIWTVKPDGTGLAQVPGGSGAWFSWTPDGKLNLDIGVPQCGMYTVNPDGSELLRVPVNDPSTCSFSSLDEMPKGAYRQPSTLVSHQDYLAAQYEPVLRFDSSEEWRPLNVEDFFGEDQHEVCEGEECTLITSASDLNLHRGEGAYINIAGHYSPGGGEADYHSPYEECTASGLRDCDSGPRSAIYWRSGGSYGGYEYLDYWLFYRANYFYEEGDFHEGDWEGITIAPSLTQGTFDYAAFSQHGTYYSYLRDVLRCEDTPSTVIPEPGTCGTEGSHNGFRVDDFVANGDHANYTTPCSEEVIFLSCQQNGSGELDRGYDGAVPWGRSFDAPATAASALLPMPAMGTDSWTDWPGHWGSPAPEGSLQGGGPASPGNQSVSIECASVNNESGCTTGPRGAGELSAAGASAETAGLSPGLTAMSCSSWAGSGVSAVACNPRELRSAVLHGAVGAPEGDLTISPPGVRGIGTSASGHGIAQYIGSGFRDGSSVEISGRIGRRTVVLVRALRGAHKHPLLGTFQLRELGRGNLSGGLPAHLDLKLKLKDLGGRLRLSLGPLQATHVSVLKAHG